MQSDDKPKGGFSPGRPKGSKNRFGYNRKVWIFEGKLYKIMHVQRHQNIVLCWDYEEYKSVGFLWSDFRRNREKCYTISEVAQLFDRHPDSVRNAIYAGRIKKPKLIRAMTKEKDKKYRGAYRFSPDDIMEIYNYFAHETVNFGNLRKDGLDKKPRKGTPTRAEVLSKLKGTGTMYVQTEDGRMVPVWSEDAY